MEEEEIWKDIVGYEGLYEVSNFGRVKSLPRMVDSRYVQRIVKEKILKNSLTIRGYLAVSLHKEGVRETKRVHQLVAVAFLGHTPNGNKMIVDHIDGSKSEPRVENIRIVTNRFNLSIGIRKDRNRLTSKYLGVSWNKESKKWVSQININGKQKHLGRFTNEIEASNAYQKELSKIGGNK